jgi:RNA polymerase-binding protein DksA
MIRKRENPDALRPCDVRRFKEALLAKQREILNVVISMEDGALKQNMTDLSNTPVHMADLGSDNFDRDNTLCLTASERKLLWEIEDALLRVEEGTYGVCEGNGENIPRARLKAIPWARCCVDCARLSEMGLLRTDDGSDDSDY